MPARMRGTSLTCMFAKAATSLFLVPVEEAEAASALKLSLCMARMPLFPLPILSFIIQKKAAENALSSSSTSLECAPPPPPRDWRERM